MIAREINFDAIVGQTHNYAGLARGNIASQKNRQAVSNPRQAALEGLAKMKFLADLGVPQAVLPPQARPDLSALRLLGYAGSDAEILQKVYRENPTTLAAVSSASAMWAANAATVSPSADSRDGRIHFTPANLISQFHRSIETQATAATFRAIFSDLNFFVHHPPLRQDDRTADEGAANHTRLCDQYANPGLQLFVYGRKISGGVAPKIFPARQSDRASRSVASFHLVPPKQRLLLQQNPAAIDAGVFHNDVAAVGNQNVFFCHGEAYLNQAGAVAAIREKFAAISSEPLHLFEVSPREFTLEEAVETYLFNSQIVTLPDGTMSLIAPAECESHPRARAVIERLLSAGTPIKSVHFLSVRQSMRNGGGPACLRLRVVLTQAEREAAHQGVFLDDVLYNRLVTWVTRHYREELRPEDLADVKLLEESQAALNELNEILKLPQPIDAPHAPRKKRS